MNGVVVLVIVALFLQYFSYIPMSVIAAILITSAVRLVPCKMIYYLFRLDKFNCFVLILTAAICLYADGALGLIVGGLLTLLNYARKSQSPLLQT